MKPIKQTSKKVNKSYKTAQSKVHSKKPLRKAKQTTGTPEIGASYALAGYFVVMLLLQLFAFDEFPSLIAGFGAVQWLAVALAIILVVTELLAIPALIRMRLPRRMELMSRVMVFKALAVLTGLEVWAFLNGSSLLFGAKFDIPGGSWSLLLLAALWILAIWQQFGERWSSLVKPS